MAGPLWESLFAIPPTPPPAPLRAASGLLLPLLRGRCIALAPRRVPGHLHQRAREPRRGEP
eukprot:12375793-Alexandrium_andersonii.AAC.1